MLTQSNNNKRIAKNTLLLYFRMLFMIVVSLYTSRVVLNALGEEDFGIGLVIISQRPSEVNRTVLSQCNNFISLRLTNVEDQNVIKRLLPDNLGNIADNLSLLDIGEAIVVGDAILLPSRIKIDHPAIVPSSQTVKFWQKWNEKDLHQDLNMAVTNMIKQSKN